MAIVSPKEEDMSTCNSFFLVPNDYTMGTNRARLPGPWTFRPNASLRVSSYRMASWSTLWALRSSAETGVLGTFRAVMICPWGIHCTASRQDSCRRWSSKIADILQNTAYYHSKITHLYVHMVRITYRHIVTMIVLYWCVLESYWYIVVTVHVVSITIAIVDIVDIYLLPWRWKLGPVIIAPGCKWAASAAHRQR